MRLLCEKARDVRGPSASLRLEWWARELQECQGGERSPSLSLSLSLSPLDRRGAALLRALQDENSTELLQALSRDANVRNVKSPARLRGRPFERVKGVSHSEALSRCDIRTIRI